MTQKECPTIARGKHYPSIREAAKQLGISDRWARRCLEIKGHLEDAGRGKIGNKNQKRRAITICGCKFESITQAARHLGMSRHAVTRAVSANASPAMRDNLYKSMMMAEGGIDRRRGGPSTPFQYRATESHS